MPDRVVYTIKKNRIQNGYHPGFWMGEDGILRPDKDTGNHYLYLRAVDSGVNDSEWGRLQLSARYDEKTVCYVYAAAMNEDSFDEDGHSVKIQDFLCDAGRSHKSKKDFLMRIGAQRTVNEKDILLYSLKGRYLYLMLEFAGEGECELSSLRIDMQGDNFMQTFPGIYQERNGFFHRYMSIFSSMYNDFENDIAKLPLLMDVDTCPESLLPVYASWMGIDVGEDFLDESVLRPLVKEAYSLNRMKGTKAALERVTQIVIGEMPRIIESNVISAGLPPEHVDEFKKVYGDGLYDVTVLVRKTLSQTVKSRLMFLLDQFKPVRADLHIICLKDSAALDAYAYLDINAVAGGRMPGELDGRQALDGESLLNE